MTRSDLFKYDFEYFGDADIGKTRRENQDVVILCPDEGFFAVSDGMGGLTDGGLTSQMVARTLPQTLKQAMEKNKADAISAKAGELLEQAVREVSDDIFYTANRGKHVGFGATVSGIWLVGDKAVFANLGDSRGYIFPQGGGALRQITVDHNVAQLLVAQGKLDKAEARFHPTSSQLMRYAGMPAPAAVDTFVETVRPGDMILACSDGLHGMADDGEIEAVMRSGGTTEHIGRQLIALANQNGGRDNISVVMLKIAG